MVTWAEMRSNAVINRNRLIVVWRALGALALMAVLDSTLAHAQTPRMKPDWITMGAYYTTYSNLSLAGSVGRQIPSSVDMEIGLRIHTVFTFMFAYNEFQSPSRPEEITAKLGGPGLGMSVDLPGFFFIGGTKWDGVREYKNRPMNTYIFGQVLRLNVVEPATGLAQQVMAPKYGWGCDVFLLNRFLHLSVRLELFSYYGDSHLGYSGGLGLSF